MSNPIICRHLVITGRVQGVAYRITMQEEAQRLGVRGWVRNRSQGDVEALVQGTPEAVEAIIEWARRGPSLAIVRNVQINEAPEGNFTRFDTLPSR
jgi:acylphosphatase